MVRPRQGLGAEDRITRKRSTCLCLAAVEWFLWAPTTILPPALLGTYSQEQLPLFSLDLPDDWVSSLPLAGSHHRLQAGLLVVGAQEMFVELRGSHSLCGVWIIHQTWASGEGPEWRLSRKDKS